MNELLQLLIVKVLRQRPIAKKRTIRISNVFLSQKQKLSFYQFQIILSFYINFKLHISMSSKYSIFIDLAPPLTLNKSYDFWHFHNKVRFSNII